jgi:hypothetical protein
MSKRASKKVTWEQFRDERSHLRALGFAHVRSVNEVPAEGTAFGSLWVHPDGREFWYNFRTAGRLPE